MIIISERYDSNILLRGDRQISDYVTSFRPGARVGYRGDLIDGSLTAGAVSEVFVRNPELNYFGMNASLEATLDNIVGRMVRGLGLRIIEGFMYSPEQQAFLTPEASESSFVRGIQARRNNALTNSATLLGTYAMTPSTQFNASYSNQMRKFLGQTISGDTGVPYALFDTTVQSFSTGPQYQIMPTHSIGASYVHQHVSIDRSSTGVDADFSSAIHGGVATWKSSLTRELTAEVSPGVSIVTRIPDKPQWTMGASLLWSDGKTSAGLVYSRGVYPSYVVSAGLLISNVVSVSVSHNMNSQWLVRAQSSHADNTRIGQQDQRFTSWSHSIAVNYSFYQGMVVSLSGTHADFIYDTPDFNRRLDRQTVILSLAAEWN
jgi:hypothetical protein